MSRKCTLLRTRISAVRQALIASWADERGGAEVLEAALVLPILMTLLLGVFWVGRGYNVYQTITRAAREGARFSVLPKSMHLGNSVPDTLSSSCISDASTSNVFNNYISPAMSASSLDPSKVTNFCQKTQWLGNATDDPHQCGVEISFAYPVEMVVPFTSINFTTININTQVQMRLENQPVVSGGSPTCP